MFPCFDEIWLHVDLMRDGFGSGFLAELHITLPYPGLGDIDGDAAVGLVHYDLVESRFLALVVIPVPGAAARSRGDGGAAQIH